MQSHLADLVARLAVKAHLWLRRKLPGAMVVEVEGRFCVKAPTTNGMFLLVDIEDAEMVLSHCWCAKRYGSQANSTWYAERRIKISEPLYGIKRIIKLHQYLIGFESWVDHRNCDGMDNRRSNLRKCTRSQNQGNSRVSFTSKSGFKGVQWRKPSGNNRRERWVARIGGGKRRVNIGSFQNPIDAARAYNAAAIAKWGEFARINNLPDITISGENERLKHNEHSKSETEQVLNKG